MHLLIIMKAKNLFCILAVILAIVAGISSCSKNKYDPEDYITSLLSGEYKKDGMWKLHVSLNGDPLENYGYVRFESKYISKIGILFILLNTLVRCLLIYRAKITTFERIDQVF